MNGNAARFFWLGGSFVGLVALGCVLTGEAAKPARRGIALPTDWSHSHLIFSQPRSAEQAMRLQEDPRFEQQWYRRYQPLLEARGPEAGSTGLSAESGKSTRRTGQMHRDWSKDLGSGGNVGAGNYPAKFSFDSSVASCAGAARFLSNRSGKCRSVRCWFSARTAFRLACVPKPRSASCA